MSKKSKLVVLGILLVLLFSINVQAQKLKIDNLEISFDIQEDDSVIQTMNFTFNTRLDKEDLEYDISKDVKDVKILVKGTEIEHKLIESENFYTIQMFPESPTNKITIIYTAENIIFRNEEVKHFFTDFNLALPIENIEVTTKLPPAYGIYLNTFKPEDSEISSDGQRIILTWQDSNIENPLFFSVKFVNLTTGRTFFKISLILLILIIFSLVIHSKIKANKAFLLGFRDDDQKVIKYIKDKKTILQRDIEREFRFSRAKTTRIIARLWEKSLIKKQKHGRTNKIEWIK